MAVAEGSQTVQQQALRDFDTAMANFFQDIYRKPLFRKHGQREGFRIVRARGRQWDVRHPSRRWSEVRVPKYAFRLDHHSRIEALSSGASRVRRRTAPGAAGGLDTYAYARLSHRSVRARNLPLRQ